MIRVKLPTHLRNLAHVNGEVELDLEQFGEASVSMVLDALEDRYPVLRGTIREMNTGKRRAFVRYFACERDLSHDSPDTPLPKEVLVGDEPLLIVGAMAGG